MGKNVKLIRILVIVLAALLMMPYGITIPKAEAATSKIAEWSFNEGSGKRQKKTSAIQMILLIIFSIMRFTNLPMTRYGVMTGYLTKPCYLTGTRIG